MLNVHLVSHTHDDVGWLKTVDQYYYGSELNLNKQMNFFLIRKINLDQVEGELKRLAFSTSLTRLFKVFSSHRRDVLSTLSQHSSQNGGTNKPML